MSLRRYIRNIIKETRVTPRRNNANPFGLSNRGQDALEHLCQVYFNSADRNHAGLIGEQIALVILGLSESRDWRNAQTDPHSTNKWLSNFPVADVMTEPLDVNNYTSFPETEFYSVKTGASHQNWESFWRFANLPSTESTIRGIRDIIDRSYGGRIPEEIEIPVGLIHIYKDDSKVYIRKQNTIPIGYRLLRSRVDADLPRRRISIGRGRTRQRFAQRTRTLSPTTRFPRERGSGNPLRFWTSNDASFEIQCSENLDLRREELTIPELTRVHWIRRVQRRSNERSRTRSTVEERMPGGNPIRVLNDDWNSALEREFRRAWETWRQSQISRGIPVANRRPPTREEELRSLNTR